MLVCQARDQVAPQSSVISPRKASSPAVLRSKLIASFPVLLQPF